MNYDRDNIFAKILRQEIPCNAVYEDDSTLAFMDIMPQADGHTLVIPKQAAADLFELEDDAAADLIVKVKTIAAAVKRAMGTDGITIFQLNGSAAGQTVPHIHFHILPGSIISARKHATISGEQEHLAAIAARIKAELER